MNKIYRLIGKEGRTTIPFDIRLKMRIGYNSLLSYEMKDENTIILRREKVCDHCSDHGVKEGSRGRSRLQGVKRSEVRKCVDQSVFTFWNKYWCEHSRGVLRTRQGGFCGKVTYCPQGMLRNRILA